MTGDDRSGDGTFRLPLIAGWICAAVGLAICIATLGEFVAKGFIAWDAPTYLAAGERLNAGHDLYALVPGDRAVMLNPPFWTVPLLSPPPIAVIWGPLAPFGSVAMLAWWFVCIASITVTSAAMIARSPRVMGPALLILSIPLAWELAAANLTGLLFGGSIVAWLLARSGHDRMAGALIGLMAAFKVWPALVIFWFIAQRRQGAVVAFLASIAIVGAISVTVAGLDAHLTYLRLGPTIHPSPGSAAGLLLSIGIDAPWAGYVIGTLAVAMMFAFRRHREATYAAGIVAVVLASPVIYVNGLALLFAALAPFVWPIGGDTQSGTPADPVRSA